MKLHTSFGDDNWHFVKRTYATRSKLEIHITGVVEHWIETEANKTLDALESLVMAQLAKASFKKTRGRVSVFRSSHGTMLRNPPVKFYGITLTATKNRYPFISVSEPFPKDEPAVEIFVERERS